MDNLPESFFSPVAVAGIGAMKLVSLHATHRTVALDDLGRLAGLPVEAVVRELAADPAVEEVAVLSTCNRFEVYLAAADPAAAHGAAFTLLSRLLPSGLPKGFTVARGLESVAHLFRVSAGLESLIVGEDQVLGQVREAYKLAQDTGTVGPVLTLLFERALVVGKKARARTRINRGAVSVGSAAVDLAERILGGLAGRRVLILGTGEMGELVARALSGRGVTATVATRGDAERARHLAEALGGTAADLSDLSGLLAASDVVITATAAPEPILHRAEVAGLTRPLLLIDIANPRNVARDVEGLPHVRLEDLDGLRRIAEENLARRRLEADAAAALVQEEVARVGERFESGWALDAVARLQARGRAVREEEVAKAVRKLALTPAQRKVVEDLAASVAKRLLAGPTEAIKRAGARGDDAEVAAARRLLGLDEEPAPPRRARVTPRRRQED